MKYVILSFDDGLYDFKENALPILKKYQMKATLNIVSGLSDGTIPSVYKYLSIDDIKALHADGFEIAAHSNSHLDKENPQDFALCVDKIKQWLNLEKVGAIMPKSQEISKELLFYFENSPDILYFADWRDPSKKIKFRGNIHRALYRLFKTKTSAIISYGYRVLYDDMEVKKYRKARFNRITVKKDREAKYFIKLIRRMPDKTYLTIVLHSIVKDYREVVDWPDGAWSISEFEDLLRYLSCDKNVNVITQKDVFS